MKDKHTQVFKGIDRFFDAYPLGSAREYLLSAIKAAESDKIWQAKAPLDLLYFFEQLQLLVIGVYEVRTEFDKSKTALHPKSIEEFDFAARSHYCGNYPHQSPWDYFPRNLTIDEYRNPYQALTGFTQAMSKKEWIEILITLKDNALSANSLSEMGIELSLVSLTDRLLKMLEACHLIRVRANI